MNLTLKLYLTYWANSNIKVKGQFLYGKRTGEWLYYNYNGHVIKRELWTSNNCY